MITLDDLAGRPTITVPECAQVLQISRNAAYQAAARGEIPTLRLGKSLRVPTIKLLELLGATPPGHGESRPASRLSTISNPAKESSPDDDDTPAA